MAEPSTPVAVALCSRLDRPAGGLDSAALAGALEQSCAGVHAEVVADLGSRPQATADLIRRSGAQRLVCAVSGREARAEDFQGWIRRAGLDPHALAVIDLGCCQGHDGSPPLGDNALLLLEAAVARMRAFGGSQPEQVRPRLLFEGRSLSRRALVSLPPWTYDAVPSVDPDSCLGKQRCGLCASACPYPAIGLGSGGVMAVDTDRCRGCGQCVTACPADAIDWPAASTAQYEAQLAVLCRGAATRVLFGCGEAMSNLDRMAGGTAALHGWLPMEVPCAGMVTPGWILQALAGGAAGVGLLGCGEDCRFDRYPATRSRVDFVHEVLRLLGESRPEERVVLATGDPQRVGEVLAGVSGEAATAAGSFSGGRLPAISLSEPGAAAGAVLALADPAAGDEAVLAHDASPLGLVRVREETCTACGACAAACPTGALELTESEESTALSFDATRCVGCLRCTNVCPEAAEETLRTDRVTDLTALRRGRSVLKSDSIRRCRRCGGPVAPVAMLKKMETLFGDGESAAMLETLTEICVECRQ